MKKFYLLIITALSITYCDAQLTGVKNIPGDFPDLATALNALNTSGVGAGGVTINVLAGNPQVAPTAAGYVIGGAGSPLLTTTSAANPVSIIGNGNTVMSFTPLTVAAINDAVIKLLGADYITITGFNISENPGNTILATSASNNMTEFGIGLFYATPTDGAQNNTILGNTISLNRLYKNSIGIFSTARSAESSLTTTAEASSPAGANSFNKVYGNNINNVNYGIVFLSPTVAANMGIGNDVGGNSSATGNVITNWGGAGPLSGYSTLTGSNYCIFFNHEINNNISYNQITSAALTSIVTEGGIFNTYSVNNPSGVITTTINNNTITVTNNSGAPTTGTVIGINNSGISPLLATATENINNNIIQNCTLGGSTATTAGMTLISQGCAAGTVNINGNTFINNGITATTSTTGTIFAIANSGVSATVNINNNLMRGFVSSSPARTSGSFVAVSNSGLLTTALNITGNQLGDITGDLVTFTNGPAGITNIIQNSSGAATCALNITGNSIKGVNLITSSGFAGILNTSGFLGNSINILNNNFGTAAGNFLNYSGANFTQIAVVNNAGGSTTGSLTITGNDIRGINLAQTATSFQYYFLNTFASLNQNISYNSFTNLSINSAGVVRFIYDGITSPPGGTKTINNNTIVTGYSKTASGGSVSFYTDGGGSTNTASASNQNNNFSNVTVTGNTSIFGWDNQDGAGTTGPVKTISNNTFSNITGGTAPVTAMTYGWSGAGSNASGNVINNISGAGFVTGVTFTGFGGSGTVQNFSQNTISNLSTTGDSVVALRVVSGATQNIFRNKIYNLQSNSATAAGFASALWANVLTGNGANTTSFYNNLIGNLTAPQTTSTDAVRGIYLGSTEAGTTNNLYYNTVYLNASSAGANFGTSAIYQDASATATINALTMNNNAFVNLSTPGATTGVTAAFKRSGNNLTNFDVSSNTNNYFGGTPSGTNLIYSDGTNNLQTLAAYKTFAAPRDALSISENPPFISTVGTDPGFLHLLTTSGSAMTNAGLPVAGITNDFDGDARDAATPDIGGDEFSFTVVAISAEYFSGTKQGLSNLLTWKIAASSDVTMTLERSSDNRIYMPVSTLSATASRCLSPFSFTDALPLKGKNYYRLKTAESNGAVKYSRIVLLAGIDNGFEFAGLSPNPVKDKAILTLDAAKTGKIEIVITDISGNIVMKQSATATAGTNMINMDFAALPAGVYQVTGITANNEKNTTRFVKY